MQWEKPSEAVSAAFDAALPDDAAVQRKKMFGFPAAFVGGNMFAGVWQTSVMLRLPPEQRRQMIEAAGASEFAPMGRVMREYVLAPESMVGDGPALSRWLEQAFLFAAALPAKEPKPRRKKADN